MADEGKRRRSRPSNWWEVDGNADGVTIHSTLSQSRSPKTNSNTDAVGGGNAKRKAKPWVPAGMNMGTPSAVDKEKKRGRPSLASSSTIARRNGENDDTRGNANGEEGTEEQQQGQDGYSSRRGRKNPKNKGTLSGKSDIIETETVTAVSFLAPKKKGRPPVGVVNAERGVGPSKNTVLKAGSRTKGAAPAKDTEVEERRRGRPAKGNSGTTNNQNKRNNEEHIEPGKRESSKTKKPHQAEPESSAPSRTKKKASHTIEEPAQKQSSKPKKRVRISDVSQTIEPQTKIKQSRQLNASEPTKKRKESIPDDQQSQQQSKRRRMDGSQDDRTETEKSEPLPYQHLEAVTRRVSHETINTKWEPLPPGCLDRISELLIDVQRPVVLQIRDERKKTQASTALQMIGRRLLSRVRKGMPFPRGTKANREDDFDFEKILNHNRALENHLTPVLHSNELLEAELRKEEILLESEEKYLEELEANAKDEATSRRQAARKTHHLLRFEGDSTQTELNDSICIDEDADTFATGLDVSSDDSHILFAANILSRRRTTRILKGL